MCQDWRIIPEDMSIKDLCVFYIKLATWDCMLLHLLPICTLIRVLFFAAERLYWKRSWQRSEWYDQSSWPWTQNKCSVTVSLGWSETKTVSWYCSHCWFKGKEGTKHCLFCFSDFSTWHMTFWIANIVCKHTDFTIMQYLEFRRFSC